MRKPNRASIVQYWDEICSAINDIKNWFLEQFSKFKTLINEFFSDAIAQGKESAISSREYIGDRGFEFVEVRDAALADVCVQARRNYNVYLIPKHVKGDHLDIAIGFPVTEEWCTKYKTHLLGYSSYTWYQNTARRLIINAGTGYTSNNPEIHLRNLNDPERVKYPKYSFSHFHNYTIGGIRDNGRPQKYSHSFFGLLKWTPNDDGVGETHPASPIY